MRSSVLLVTIGLAACSPDAGKGKEIVLLPFPDDAGEVTWDGWAGAFVRDYCTECHQPSAPCGGSGCHATGDPALFDFHDESAVVLRADVIRCGIATKQDPSWSCADSQTKKFPIIGDNPLPTDEQRAIVVDWIEAGCP